jgi:molybdenum cofactor cytidylyltransferase
VTAGLILAAGEGRRFGATKQLAPLRGRPLLEHAVSAMLAVPRHDRVVGAEHHDDAIRARVRFGDAEVVVCEDWARGQSASLRRGIEALAGADAVVITLGDQPFITPKVIEGALDQLGAHDAVRATYAGVPGHPVVLGRRVLAAIPSLEGDVGARELLAGFDVKRWEAGELASAADIDTPADLAALDR